MPFLSTTLRISLIIFAVSHIAIAGPVPQGLGSPFSSTGEKASGGSVSSSGKGGSLLAGLDLLNLLSGNGGKGGDVDSKKLVSHNKGGGESPPPGKHHGHEKTVGKTADAFSGFDESADGGSVSEDGGLLNILSGNGGNGGEAKGLDDMLNL